MCGMGQTVADTDNEWQWVSTCKTSRQRHVGCCEAEATPDRVFKTTGLGPTVFFETCASVTNPDAANSPPVICPDPLALQVAAAAVTVISWTAGICISGG